MFVQVALAALTAFVFGGWWYSPSVCLGRWKAASERGGRVFGQRSHANGHSQLTWAVAIAASLVAAYATRAYLDAVGVRGVAESAAHGLWIGATFVATSFTINYVFGDQSFELLLVDGVYHIFQFGLYGLTLSALQQAGVKY
jgi:hypothetical protein